MQRSLTTKRGAKPSVKFENMPGTVLSLRTRADISRDYTKISKAEHDELTMIAESMIARLPAMMVDQTRASLIGGADLGMLAVCQCTKLNTRVSNTFLAYDPSEGKIDDPRMGTLKSDMTCRTCNQNDVTCPGHFGQIPLPMSVIHPLLKKLAVYILNMFCITCGERYFDESDLEKVAGQPFMIKIRVLSELSAKKSLSDVKTLHPRCDEKYEFSVNGSRIGTDDPESARFDAERPSYTIYNVQKGKGGKKITSPVEVDEIEKWLQQIMRVSSPTLEYIGFVRDPAKSIIDLSPIIMKAIPVIPPVARPFGMIEGDMQMNKLTKAYLGILEIITTTRDIASEMGVIYGRIEGLFTMIQDEIKGKEGIIRGLSMGKRVEYSGRSVLGPYNKLVFGYVACPERMRRLHTKPVAVAAFNLAMIKDLYRRGEITHVILGDYSQISRNRIPVDKLMLDKYTPQIGDTVEVMGMDGDETLFNRQPTLDKLSIMGYKAYYVPDPEYLCFGLHSSYTTPHNADYDGDEGNIHKIQTLDARSEVRHIASVEANIMNPKASKPTMGLVYNCLSAAYLISLYGKIDPQSWEMFLEILQDKSHLEDFDDRLEMAGVEPYTGKALFSILFPGDFYYDHGGVKIRQGIFLSGTLTDANLGPVSGSIIHHMWKFYGKERTSRFFTEGQQLLDQFIEWRGFTVGFSSCIPDDAEKIASIIDAEISQAQIQIKALGPKTADMTQLELETHERKVMSYLNAISRIGQRIALDGIGTLNPLNVMMNSGAKGKASNVAQILGCLGQQFVAGARPARSLTGKTRSLPYFEPNSDDIEADGFVPESFMVGSRPSGFTYHMMASRIGLMDTALKTADIGHMHRRMVKVLEDLTVAYDGSVRNANGVIFGYSYSDGFSAAEVMRTSSEALGTVLSFIDLKAVTGKLNAEAGYF